MQPTYDQTTMYEHRSQIRGNDFLNKLLHDNNNGLRSIYERYKDELNFFTMESAIQLFKELKDENFKMKSNKIKEQFVLSLMTVIDETIPNKIKKYEYLLYVEFLEMICRIALEGVMI